MVWTTSSLGKDFTVFRLTQVTFRTFLPSPFAFRRFALYTFLFCFSLFTIEHHRSSPTPSSTHSMSCTPLPFSELSCISDTAAPRLRRRAGLSPAVPSSSSSFSLFLPLAHFARRILVSYHLSPAYKTPAPGLVKMQASATHFPLLFYFACFCSCQTVQRRTEPAEPSLVPLVLRPFFCCFSRCPRLP